MPDHSWRQPTQGLWVWIFLAFVVGMIAIIVVATVPGIRGTTYEWVVRMWVVATLATALFTRLWERRLSARAAKALNLLCPVCRLDLSGFKSATTCRCPGCGRDLELEAVQLYWSTWAPSRQDQEADTAGGRPK